MTDALQDLHTALVNARNGYEEAAREARDSVFKSLFSEMASSKQAAHSQLHPLLRGEGEDTGDEGSFMTAVHKTVIDIRAAVSGLGANALNAFISGEETILAQYDRALDACRGNAAATTVLETQKEKLHGEIARMRSLQT